MFKKGKNISDAGAWCSIYLIEDQPGKCAKILADHRGHDPGLDHPQIFAQKKYGINDLLEHELKNYRRLIKEVPHYLRSNFVNIDGIDYSEEGERAIVMDLVFDDHGKIAPSLDNNQRELQPEFFLTLEQIRREVLIRNAIDYFGVCARNILVVNPKTSVLIDFQKDRRFFRSQYWLALNYFVRLKVNRYFQRVYQEAGIPDLTTATSLADVALQLKKCIFSSTYSADM